MIKQNKKMITIGLMFLMISVSLSVMISTASGNSTPAISFHLDDENNLITIVSAESGYHYAEQNISGSVNGSYFDYANLVFLKDYSHYYYVGLNMTLTDSIYPSTQEIKTGDEIYGFSEGTYMVKWKPTGSILWNFSVTETETNQLEISASSSVTEGESFFVSVTCEGSPVSGATVIFGNNSYITSINGTYITAPDVNADTSYNLIASKSGYEYDSDSILVKNQNSNTTNQLEISAPSSVTEGESFFVSVSCNGEPVEDVFVHIGNYSTSYTSLNGTYLDAPLVSYDQIFTISASKAGYDSDVESILVMDKANNNSENQLEISCTSSVDEGEYFHVLVSCNGELISGVSVSFLNGTYITSKNGTVLTAPMVQSDHSYDIYASKSGYESDMDSILVKDKDNISEDELEISAPSSVTEGESFFVYVTSDGKPVDDVFVFIDNYTWGHTSLNGTYLEAPMVDSDQKVIIQARKKGYTSAQTSILVKDSSDNNTYPNVNISKEELRRIGGEESAGKIKEAIFEKKVGSEIFVWKNLNKNVTKHEDLLEFKKVELNANSLSMIVSGNHSLSGKTLAINVEKGFFKNQGDIRVLYDDENICMASDIDDILDPDDDGSHPEYLIVQGSAGTQVLVSIPHFSDHKIDVFSIVDEEDTDGILMIAYYVIVSVLAAVIFIGIIGARKKIR